MELLTENTINKDVEASSDLLGMALRVPEYLTLETGLMRIVCSKSCQRGSTATDTSARLHLSNSTISFADKGCGNSIISECDQTACARTELKIRTTTNFNAPVGPHDEISGNHGS